MLKSKQKLNDFWLWIVNTECFNSHFFDDFRRFWFVAIACSYFCDTVYFIHTFDYFTECCISAIQMWSVFVHDEELAACRVRMHGTCHGDYARFMFQIVLETILVELAADAVARAAHTVAVWTTALNHESVDYTMEGQTIVEAFVYQMNEVVYSVRSNVWL